MADFAVARTDARTEIRAGLLGNPPSISPKFFYDPVGSDLFERITRTPEYYLTAAEIGILESNLDEIADGIGPRAVLAEIAAGSARKARIVLGGLRNPAAYAPVDIAEEMLAGQAAAVRRDFPDLKVIPVAADFSADFTFPAFDFDHARIAVFYAGSSLGNFEPEEASAFLARLARAAGSGSRLLLGVDRKKDKTTLDRAYNDPGGLNAAFNRNILNNVNRLADGDFDPERWIPHQSYDEARGRIGLWLESAAHQTVRVAGEILRFAPGDRIHTENSYKYDVNEVLALAGPAWTALHLWCDPADRFSVFLFGCTP
jgi:dimethylhistidine N-methyltransferase